jgi:hypothetical protein
LSQVIYSYSTASIRFTVSARQKRSTPHYLAILSYVEQPDMVGTPKRLKQLYGRVLPIHLERAGLRADSYLD